tara:strand:+ start:538 stop:789 length:252 start_codon:yes stop_codon:yes gene_type:complete
MVEVERRYIRSDDSSESDNDDEDETRIEKGDENSEWFDWTGNIVFLADKLNRDVDKITDMSYVSFLFWNNYFRLKHEEEYRNK